MSSPQDQTRLCLWLNSRSKGNLGYSTAVETGVNWLLRHGIEWHGTNLDDRHLAFANRHPHRVVNASLRGGGIEGKNELLKTFRSAFDTTEPVYVIDTPAQADSEILNAIDELKILDLAEQSRVRIVCWLIPYDDDEHTRNLIELIQFLDNRVHWFVVQNPVKSACRTYPGSGMQKALHKLGAKEIVMPGITPLTRVTLERVCLSLGQELSLAEAALAEQLPLIMRGEIQNFLGNMYNQLDNVASHLVPEAVAAGIKPIASAPSRTRKILDLMADYGRTQ